MEKENKEKHKEVEGTVTPEKKTKVKRSLLCFTLTPGLLYWSGEGVVLDSTQRPGEVQYNQIYLHCEICDAYQHDNTTNGLEEKIEEKYEKAE